MKESYNFKPLKIFRLINASLKIFKKILKNFVFFFLTIIISENNFFNLRFYLIKSILNFVD